LPLDFPPHHCLFPDPPFLHLPIARWAAEILRQEEPHNSPAVCRSPWGPPIAPPQLSQTFQLVPSFFGSFFLYTWRLIFFNLRLGFGVGFFLFWCGRSFLFECFCFLFFFFSQFRSPRFVLHLVPLFWVRTHTTPYGRNPPTRFPVSPRTQLSTQGFRGTIFFFLFLPNPPPRSFLFVSLYFNSPPPTNVPS